jgi:glycosyltransferase involved in cell wall biosynthesis
MKLNVVMLVRDRPRLSEQSITSMFRNRTQDFHLTVIDDASEPSLEDKMRGHVRGNIYRRAISAGTGSARNWGVSLARQAFGTDNLLYLSDNDVYFQPGWDAVLLAAYRNFPNVKIIGGGCHPFMQPAARRDGFIGGAGSLQLIYHMTYRDAISGYSWLLDWETWDRFGPLEANALGVRQGEDWAMCQRIIKAGFEVGSIVPEVVLHCGTTDTFGQRPPGWELIEAAGKSTEGIIIE